MWSQVEFYPFVGNFHNLVLPYHPIIVLLDVDVFHTCHL